jgi:hypothetical protein
MALEDYPLAVEMTSPRSEVGHVLVYADDLIIARKAFEAAVQQYPTTQIAAQSPQD